jgi:hypothetical protein
MHQVVRREACSENALLWKVSAPDVAAAVQPGHFVMLRRHKAGERIPSTKATPGIGQAKPDLVINRWPARPDDVPAGASPTTPAAPALT